MFLRAPFRYLAFEPVKYLPDCARDLQNGSHHYINIRTATGDHKFHYVANGERGKALVLFLHGFPECWYSWRYQLRSFTKDYWAVAVDMRGYADTDKPAGIANYRLDVLREDVLALINGLGYEKCVLVAHDWGGAVAWSVAGVNPEYVEKLIILNSPHGGAFSKRISKSWKQFFASWYMFWFQSPFSPELTLSAYDFQVLKDCYIDGPTGLKNKENITPEDLMVFKYYFQDWAARSSPINYYRAAMRYATIVNREKIQPKTMIIWGTDDKALTTELAQDSAERCEDCTLKYVEGASHWVQQDSPDEVNRYIHDFLSK